MRQMRLVNVLNIGEYAFFYSILFICFHISVHIDFYLIKRNMTINDVSISFCLYQILKYFLLANLKFPYPFYSYRLTLMCYSVKHKIRYILYCIFNNTSTLYILYSTNALYW